MAAERHQSWRGHDQQLVQQGAVQDDAESLAIIKTTADRYPALATRLAQLHPYEVPEIIALPLAGGHPPYLAWLAGQVTPG